VGQRRAAQIATGLVGAGRTLAGVGLLLARLGPALVFLAHGYLKILGGHHDRTVALFLTVNIPFAEPAAWFIGGLELAGGLALLLGVAARPFALLLAAEMAVAILAVRLRQGWVGAAEYEAVLLLTCLAVALLGAGPLSLAAFLRRSGPPPVPPGV